MTIIETPKWRIDYTDDGAGEAVILVHSSAGGNRQWRRLIESLRDRYRLLAINLFGYGETTPWPGDRVQTLADQAELIQALADTVDAPVCVVGHSLGGAVAMKAAALMADQVSKLILFEPNPFHHLAQHGRTEAYAEVCALRDLVQRCAGTEDWTTAAKGFATYWIGDGAWDAMTEDRQVVFADALPPNVQEWDAVMNETATVESWSEMPARVLLLWGARSRSPMLELAVLLRDGCPDWRHVVMPGLGHMAPLDRPEIVNPLIAAFLDEAPD